MNVSNPRNVKPSEMDDAHHRLLRQNVTTFVRRLATTRIRSGRLLEVAPQDYPTEGLWAPELARLTLDIDPDSGCDIIGDICNLRQVASDQFDHVLCTEVLEHTMHPWNAVQEVLRILRPGGHAYVSTPFNFRIHGPLPDCWRFTEHGLRALFAEFKVVELTALETPGRPLMPIQYTLIAQKPTRNA